MHHRNVILVKQRGYPVVFNTNTPRDLNFYVKGIWSSYRSTYVA